MDEKQRLLKLLDENKISEEEYHLLSKSLDKPKVSIESFFDLLIKPYPKIPLSSSILFGSIFLIATSVMAHYAKMHFPDPLTVLTIGKSLSIPELLMQNLIIVFTVSGLFFGLSKLLKQKNIRYLDFLSYILVSRFPYFLLTAFVYLSFLLIPSLQDPNSISPNFGIILKIISFTLLIWQVILYFTALKEASGLDNKKTLFVYISSLILSIAIIYILKS